LAANTEQFQQSDIKVAGIAALMCAGLAFFAANVSGLVPSSALIALHVPKNDMVSVSQLRQQLAELRTETAQLRRQSEMLNTRFSLQEQTGNEVIRRVGALEVSMPTLQEMRPLVSTIDRSVTTASIGERTQQMAADGGSVVVRNSPLAENAAQQPLPPVIETAALTASGADVGYGVAIGSGFAPGQAASHWRDLEVRLGSVLGDMNPLVTDEATGSNQRLVAGPLAQMTEARDLCPPTIYSGQALR
jgi:DNA-binding transcriptional regulator YbjK